MANQTLETNDVTVTEETYEQATRLLAYLGAHLEADWHGALVDVLNANELAAAEAAVERVGEVPAGAYRGGTGQAKDGAGLSGEDAQVAIGWLKTLGYLIQCGRGRGKALLVMRTDPLPRPAGRTRSTSATPRRRAPSPRAEATAAAREAVMTEPPLGVGARLDAELTDLRRDHEELLERIARLEAAYAQMRDAFANGGRTDTWS